MEDLPNIDLRQELRALFKDHYQWYGLRQPDYTKKCGCISSTDGIAAPDKNCTRCLATGYIFTDYIVRGYSWLGVLGFEFPSGPGIISTQSKQIIFEYAKPINKFDLVLELDQELSGPKLRTPFRITRSFLIQDSNPMRLDNARVEYWRCNLEERNISDYRPGEQGTGYTYKGNRSSDDPV